MPNIDSTEIWKPIPNFENIYSISNLGKVRRDATGKGTQIGRILKPWSDSSGYPQVTLHLRGKRSDFKIHVLVAKVFIGMRPKGEQINHIDGNKTNPRWDNLEYVTMLENHRHAVRMNLNAKGERHARAKLTEEKVRWIRLSSLRNIEIARILEICPSNISEIRSRKSWVHVK